MTRLPRLKLRVFVYRARVSFGTIDFLLWKYRVDDRQGGNNEYKYSARAISFWTDIEDDARIIACQV
jgi:hypothetical protein